MDNKTFLHIVELKRNTCATRLKIKSDDDVRTLNNIINIELGKLLETNDFGLLVTGTIKRNAEKRIEVLKTKLEEAEKDRMHAEEMETSFELSQIEMIENEVENNPQYRAKGTVIAKSDEQPEQKTDNVNNDLLEKPGNEVENNPRYCAKGTVNAKSDEQTTDMEAESQETDNVNNDLLETPRNDIEKSEDLPA